MKEEDDILDENLLSDLFKEINLNNTIVIPRRQVTQERNWRSRDRNEIPLRTAKFFEKNTKETSYNWRNRSTSDINKNDGFSSNSDQPTVKKYSSIHKKIFQPSDDFNRDNEIKPVKIRYGESSTNVQADKLNLSKFFKLESEESEIIILTLLNNSSDFQDILKGCLSFNHIVTILSIFQKMCETNMNKNKYKVILHIINGKFLNTLLKHISTISVQSTLEKKLNTLFWSNPNTFWNNILIFIENIFDLMPNTACELLPKVIKASLISINDIEKNDAICILSEIKKKFEDFNETIIKYKEKTEETVTQEPPNNFRFISVYPTVEEVTALEEPFIRPIINDGAYESVEHYLDVQFRLLKEDFTASLRNGVHTYLNKNMFERTNQFDVRIYENVHFVKPVIIQDQVGHLVQYKNDKQKALQFNKQFIYGSLVCFTSDNFNTLIVGVTLNNDLKYLKKGQIVVDIRVGNITYNQFYTMIECSVFFEPYYQVLQALKEIHSFNFPFVNYIIHVSPQINPPKYLKNTTVAYFLNEKYKFKILSPETWPKAHQVRLNDSQFDAFQAALTKEFCIIQGPPGTGKTYTTLRIVEFLLRNKQLLNYDGQILVVCYTNHALDQFLEGILPFTQHVLRVGGQSKNKAMDKYNLKRFKRLLQKLKTRRRKSRRNRNCSVNCNFSRYDSDYSSGDENYYFEDYITKSIFKLGQKEEEYYSQLEQMNELTQLIDDVLSFRGIINFKYLNKFDCNNWCKNKSNVEIIEWLLHDDKNITENVIENLPHEEENYEDELYLQLNDLYNERILENTICNEFILNKYANYITTIDDYNKKKENIRAEMGKLDLKIETEYELYRQYQQQIMMCDQQQKKLFARLHKCDLNNYAEPPDPVIRNADDRWYHYFHSLYLFKLELFEEIINIDTDLRKKYSNYKELSQINDIYIMRKMKVIGMTTTGATRNRDILEHLRCPIVIVEEAAEVLESHIIVSLTKSCQHLILIGDHKQLRPSTAQYKLAKKYNLEISLFERMVQNNIHCHQLNVQHRMRPEIASLIVPAIYSNLSNAPSVEEYPPVLGVTRSLYFITHSNFENKIYNDSSHKNEYEAIYLIELAKYLLKQEYEPSDITILTTYKGQMFYLLQEKLKYPELDQVRTTVVDNFQGEESKIILLSLVRSNADANIGFLKTENRVCVALSRAKEGFYIIGNMDNLIQNNTVWNKIKEALENQNSIGRNLLLSCQVHSNLTFIHNPEDFKKVPNGGCNIPCNTKLKCGHVCGLLCHPYDREHEEYFCNEIVTKQCPNNHSYEDKCSSNDYSCLIKINVKLPCGHSNSIQCSTNLENYECQREVEVTLKCGHNSKKKCSTEIEDAFCLSPCNMLLDCGHICQNKCHINKDPDHEEYVCKEPCLKFSKDCSTKSHQCKNLCNEQCSSCEEIIKKRRVCNHLFKTQCNSDVDKIICKKNCRKVLPCQHFCKKKCYQECGDCSVMVKKVIEECGHSIKVRCPIKPTKSMCTEKCTREFQCGHTCPKKCYEICLDNCKHCSVKNVNEIHKENEVQEKENKIQQSEIVTKIIENEPFICYNCNKYVYINNQDITASVFRKLGCKCLN